MSQGISIDEIMMTGTKIIDLPLIKYFQWNYSIIYGTAFVTSQTVLSYHFCCLPFGYLFIIWVTIIEWRCYIIEIWICNIQLVSKTLSAYQFLFEPTLITFCQFSLTKISNYYIKLSLTTMQFTSLPHT